MDRGYGMENVGSRDGKVATLSRELHRVTADLDYVVGKLNTSKMEVIAEEANMLPLHIEKKALSTRKISTRNNILEAENVKIRSESNAFINLNESQMNTPEQTKDERRHPNGETKTVYTEKAFRSSTECGEKSITMDTSGNARGESFSK